MECKIYFKTEQDKEEFIKTCRHIHDFTVFFRGNRKKRVNKVIDLFGVCRQLDGKTKQVEKPKYQKIGKDCVGIGLNQYDFPFVNFLAHLYTDYAKEKYLIVDDSNFEEELSPLTEEYWFRKTNFDDELSVKLSKFVHDNCEEVPHDIGIHLARIVKEHREK
jgi:hypothetical protein